MKKKKPKKSPKNSPTRSPAKSPPKTASQVKSVSAKENPLTSDSKIVSDVQIGCSADPVAQQSKDTSDLSPDLSDVPTKETVITVQLADPYSARDVTNSTALELSSAGLPLSSSVEVSEDGVVPSDKLNSDVVTLVANADAKVVTLSSQAADDVSPSNAGTGTGSSESSPSVATQAGLGAEKQRIPIAEDVVKNSSPAINPNQDGDQPSLNKAPEDSWCAHAKGLGK